MDTILNKTFKFLVTISRIINYDSVHSLW